MTTLAGTNGSCAGFRVTRRKSVPVVRTSRSATIGLCSVRRRALLVTSALIPIFVVFFRVAGNDVYACALAAPRCRWNLRFFRQRITPVRIRCRRPRLLYCSVRPRHFCYGSRNISRIEEARTQRNKSERQPHADNFCSPSLNGPDRIRLFRLCAIRVGIADGAAFDARSRLVAVPRVAMRTKPVWTGTCDR